MSQGLPSAAKIKALNEILDDLPPTESFIIYTWFRESAELVYQELLKRNETSFKIDGSLDSRGRDLVVQDWKRYPGTGLVGTLASMSEGLDLFNANIAIFFEHDYVPKTLEQAVGRLDRSGQTKPVTIYHIYHQRTIEAAVLRVAERRADSIAEAISGDWEDEDF
jgi:SNF2 family DNA or RNA helicase